MTNEAQVAERAALNQSRFRAHNERMEATNATRAWVDPPMPDWACECASENCMVAVPLTIAQYEAVRESPTRFLVAPGDEHVVPEVELVVERNERYWVIEKVGDAADVSEALDERVHPVVSAPDEHALAADAAAWNVPRPVVQRAEVT